MHRLTRIAVLALALALPGAVARAQASPAAAPAAGIPRPATDSIFRRARRLVLEGNGPAGRALVDSLLKAAAPGSTAYGDALYWHGALAPTAAEAERDYRRVIVEYPLAYYADDALLAIAELEQARGDRAGALAHLLRFVKEHPASPARGIAALGAARLAFEQRDTRTGCAMIAEARASAASGDVELTNQIAYYGNRCPPTGPATVAKLGSVSTPAATTTDTQSTATRSGVRRVRPDSIRDTPPSTRPAVDTAPRLEVAPAPRTEPVRPSAPVVAPAPAPAANPPARGRYTIQLAAYNTRAEAEQFVATLARRNVEARVSGTTKPFRVRLGYWPTRAAAAAEVAAMRRRGMVGFVAEEAP